MNTLNKKELASIIVFTILLGQTYFLSAADYKDNDKSVDSVVYVLPGSNTNGKPVQAETKNIKLRELDQQDIQNVNENIDEFIFGSEKDSYSTMSDEFAAIPKNNGASIYMGNPVYVRGREQAIKRMPVLDQGQSDTCATFSSTAAMDILSGNGSDKYSNYMSLCLGQALSLNIIPASADITGVLRMAKANSLPNPWDGSEGVIIFSQFKSFGLVEKNDQNSQNGLFGNTEVKQPLSLNQLKDFKKVPVKYTILFHTFVSNIKKVFKTESAFIAAVKKEINNGNIVSIGIVIATGYQPSNSGMIGSTKITGGKAVFSKAKQKNIANYNTWCSDQALGLYIKKNANNEDLVGSHQMIVIGYIDNPKKKDDGLLIVRNSWGANSGDKGNNYITYDYAYLLSDELLSISAK